MPRAFDLNRSGLRITHDPTASLGASLPKSSDFDALGNCTNEFVLGLAEMGTGLSTFARLGTGLQTFVDSLLGLLVCDLDGSVTPQSMLDGLEAILAPALASPFVQGLVEFAEFLGRSTGTFVVDVFHGLIGLVDWLFGVFTCDPEITGTTPLAIINGLQSVLAPMVASPFVQGLVEFAEFLGRQTGTFIGDVFQGLVGLADWFCGVLTCNPGNSGTTPMTIVNGVQAVIDRILEIPFVAGIIDFAEDVGVAAGNFILDLINGTVAGVQALCSLVTTGALPTEWGSWSNTPGQLIDDLTALVTELFDNPLVNGLRDLIEGTGNALFDIIRGAGRFVTDLAGLLGPLLAGPQAIIDFLGGILGPDGFLGWLMTIPFIGPLVSRLTGQTPADGVSLDLGQLDTWARGLLTGQSALPAGNLVGQLADGVLAGVSVSHINDSTPNLVSQGNFNNDYTVETGGGWSWDGTTTATGTGGSAKCTADGSLQQLFSRQVIKVANGDRVNISAKVKTSGFTAAAGRSMVLAIIPWKLVANLMTAQPEVVIATRTTASVGSWATLSGSTYVVANDIIRLTVRLGVTANSGAVIWYDDVHVSKSGGLLQGMVDRLFEGWGGVWAAAFGGAVTNRTVDDVFTAAAAINSTATTASTNLGTLQTGLSVTPQSVIGSILNVVVDGITTVQGLLNTLATNMGGSGSSNRVSHVGTRAGVVTSTANAAATNASTAQALAAATNTNAYNAWYGSGGGGSAADMSAVIQSIKSSVDGWTVEVINTSGTWTRPVATARIIEFWAICIGGGGGGDKGESKTTGSAGGDGGIPGRWMAKQITPSSIGSTVSVTVGAGGAGRASHLGSPSDNGGASSFGSLCSSSEALTASIGSLVGFYSASDSRPGVGGKGGEEAGGAKAGNGGGSTPLAAGGAAGGVSGGQGASGGPGGSANLSGAIRAGGGGGGGGGASNTPLVGGVGGAGGRPGGGGGGGGAAWSFSPTAGGNGGDGGHGNVVLLYRIKT